MGSGVTLTSAVRNNLLSLQNTASLLSRTQERLATGLKVNSALDDPTAFFTANSLNTRGNDLSRLLDAVSNAVQTIEASDQGITSITKLVQAAQASARQALVPAPGSTTPTTLTGTTAFAADADVIAATGILSISVNGGPAETIDLDGIPQTLVGLDAALAAITGVTAVRNGSDFVEITGLLATDSITITGGENGVGLTDGTTPPPFSSERASLETEFNNLLIQIDQMANDASFNGNNLLDGENLTVVFNEDATSTLDITGVTFDSAGIGLTVAAVDSYQTDAGVNAKLAEIDLALATLSTQAKTFGSNLTVVNIRQEFTKNLIVTLETGAANLTLADANEEGANTLALQTRQQLSSVALSLAAQADQQVLRLFQ